MKRFIICLLAAAAMALASGAACAETLGWGFVNATDVALRRGMGGKVITRLPEDTCVWINDSRRDSNGVLWYEISAGLNVNHANYDYFGWMKAEFIDAGEEVWHDVTAIAAASHGLIALRADGSTETAGQPVVAMDGSAWVSPRGWAAPFGRAVRVGIPTTGNAYFIVTERGELVESVNGIPGANGHAKADTLEAAMTIIAGEAFPAWSQEAQTVVFRSMGILRPGERRPTPLYVGIRANGTVMAEPAFMAELLADWTDMADIRLTGSYVLGLKRDGTVLLAAFQEGIGLDVSRWQNVVAIGVGRDWCVGLTAEGTLVFEGSHVLMNEGHIRR